MYIYFRNNSENQCNSISSLLKATSGSAGYDRVWFYENSVNRQPITVGNRPLENSFYGSSQNLGNITLSGQHGLAIIDDSSNGGSIVIDDVQSSLTIGDNNGTVINNAGYNDGANGEYILNNYGEVHNYMVHNNYGDIYSDDKNYLVMYNHSNGYVYGSVMFQENSGTIEKGYLPFGGCINSGVVLTAYFANYSESTTLTNTGTINVSADATTGIAWKQFTPYYIVNNDNYWYFLSGSNNTIEDAESNNEHIYVNPIFTQVANDGYFQLISNVHYAVLSGKLIKYTGQNPQYIYEYIVDGVVSNLDSQGNNAFYAQATVVNGENQASGTYTTWNSKFYQGGVPYTGSMAYDEYEANAYGQYVPNGNTGYVNFANGVAY